LSNGTFQVFSSDHAPFRYNDPHGKLRFGAEAIFSRIPNGIPGIETRLPLLFSEGVMKGRLSVQKFVQLTAANPAKLYGLYPRKGTIAIGSDADFAIWNTLEERVIRNEDLHHNVDYTPYEGMALQGWPETAVVRGEVVQNQGKQTAAPGYGMFLKCDRPLFVECG
jgi:dihydropyrimidinase